MHDFHLADQIVKIAKDYAQKNCLSQITEIVVELGEIIEHGEGITPASLKHNIKLLMAVKKVKIKRIKGDSWKLISIDGESF